jgi:hypothetical protein
VPRTLDIELLAKITTLVEHYDLAEAVELYSAGWIKHALEKTPVPDNFCSEVILWLYVSDVFKHAPAFEAASYTAIQTSRDDELRTLGLDISKDAFAYIDSKRDQLISYIFTDLETNMIVFNQVGECYIAAGHTYQCVKQFVETLNLNPENSPSSDCPCRSHYYANGDSPLYEGDAVDFMRRSCASSSKVVWKRAIMRLGSRCVTWRN